MGAALCAMVDDHHAMGASAGRRRWRRIGTPQSVHPANHKKEGQGHDNKAEYGVDEAPIAHHHCASALGGFKRLVGRTGGAVAQHEKLVAQIEMPREEAKGGA